uniref:Ketoreductase domain-containing protein n=1 Tax=Heliothis virescens TaxID=7102 RepID=A0A2A4JCF4_HELVI
MEISFKGKRILVTGAGQGIGRGIAVELWRAGANIVALSRTRSHLETLQSEYPSIDIVDVDVADWEKTRKVVESLGHFDALVNNAAIAICEPFLDCSPSDFDKMFNINVKATLNISQIVARKMVENKTHGAIVNISSQASKSSYTGLKMEISFKGKRILVTGAGQGIGRGIAVELWRAGANIVALSRTRSHLETLQSEYPSIDIVDVDVADWEKTRKVVESLGHFDALVNNAAIAICEPFLDCSPSDFDKMFNINVKATLNISQIVARKMVENKTHGAIVNISSQASKAALKDHAIYSASKAALDALTRSMALELGPYGIRVNSVNPTVIMTEMAKVGWSDPAKASAMLAKIPLGRFGEVSEVVNAVVFLLSERSSMINGVELPIDGGFLAT